TASESMPAARCRTLTAARRLSSGCCASYTAPYPPSPSLRNSRYSPAMRPVGSLSGSLLGRTEDSSIRGRDDTTPRVRSSPPLLPQPGVVSRFHNSAAETEIDADRGCGRFSCAVEGWTQALTLQASARGRAEALSPR